MAIRDVTERDAVLDAIDECDELGVDRYRERYGLAGQSRVTVTYLQTPYDGRDLIAAAHRFQRGVPLSAEEVTGEDLAISERLQRLDFNVELTPPAKAVRPTRGTRSAVVWDLAEGAVRTRKQISQQFGGATYGGIEPSGRTPNVFIYTDPSRGATYGYDHDEWLDDDTFLYTGEGRKGDQRMVEGNRAIVEHFHHGRTLRVFEAIEGADHVGEKTHRYVGAFSVDPREPYTLQTAPDIDGVPRKVFVFRLVRDVRRA